MYLLYKNDITIARMALIAHFETYEAMCEKVGWAIADEGDFGYEGEDGGFHQTEHDADRYADTFWKERRVETLGGEKYMFERIEASERELRKFLDDSQPVAMQDQFGNLPGTEADRANEQRFHKEVVKKWVFNISPPDWDMATLKEPYFRFITFRPTEALARAAYQLSVVSGESREIGDNWHVLLDEESDADAQAAYERSKEAPKLPW